MLAHADSVVKGLMCSKDNLQHLLDLTQKLQPPGLIKVRGSSSSSTCCSCLGSDSVCACLSHTCTGVCWQGLCRLSRYAGQEAAHVQRHLGCVVHALQALMHRPILLCTDPLSALTRPPNLTVAPVPASQAMKTIRWLTSEASVLPDMKNSGAIGQLVRGPAEGHTGQLQGGLGGQAVRQHVGCIGGGRCKCVSQHSAQSAGPCRGPPGPTPMRLLNESSAWPYAPSNCKALCNTLLRSPCSHTHCCHMPSWPGRVLPLQVPFLSRDCEAAHGQAVVLEALQALYNICFFHKRVHLEVAASNGIVPHLCR